MKKAAIILLASIACLTGCDSNTESDNSISSEPQRPEYFASTNSVDIKENIRLIHDTLAKSGATRRYYDLSVNLYNSVTSITDAATAVMACDAWLDALFEVDISRFSYKEQAEINEHIGRITDTVYESMKSVKLSREEWRELWFVKKIESTIKYLKWKKRFIKQLRPKHRVENPNLVLDMEEDAERTKWYGLYYDGMGDYEYRLRNIEQMLPYWARGIPTNTVKRITAMVEEHIGRPIRTEAQCREDHRLKRFVEFTEKPDRHAAP